MTKTLSRLTKEEREANFAAAAARQVEREAFRAEILKTMPDFVKPFYKNGRVSLGWIPTEETIKAREWVKSRGWEYHNSGRGYYPRGV